MIYVLAMEKFSSHDRENFFTPQRLNHELKAVVNALPKVSVAEEINLPSKVVGQRIVERENSAYTTKIQERVKTLVEKAQITDQFKQLVIDRFTFVAEIGFDRTSENFVQEMFFFLDHSHLNSGGIFDPHHAARLERIAIMQEARLLQMEQRVFTKLVDEERAKKTYAPKIAALQEWKEQITQRYGEYNYSK